MKSLKIAALVITAMLGGNLCFAQSTEEIVAKYLDAIGGKDNWKKVNTLKTQGNLNVMGNEIVMQMTVVNGKGMRNDITAMGVNGYQIITPTEGWIYMPFQGQAEPQALPKDVVDMETDQLDVQGVLVDYKEKGHSVEYLGKAEEAGVNYLKLKIINKNGRTMTYFLDPSTYLLQKSVSRESIEGQEIEKVINYHDYKKLPEGILMAMTINMPLQPGLNADLVVTKVSVNEKVDEEIFKPSK